MTERELPWFQLTSRWIAYPPGSTTFSRRQLCHQCLREKAGLTNANPLPESHGGEHASHFARYPGFDEVKL